jgi:hypothetical protein
MQKIQSYLYPNRVILLADLAGFTTENTVVYAKTVKIYNGIDNTIQFDIQNADQKRLNLTTLTNIEMNVMDMAGNALPESPYTVTPTAITGVGTVTIPADDLVNLADQNLRYSVTAVNGGSDVMLYCDSRFSAVGTIQLIGNALPKIRDDVVYNRFSGEINFMGNVINHTSAIPCKFYESVAVEVMDFSIAVTGFVGTIYVEATEDSTISVESFRDAPKLQTFATTVATTTTVNFDNVPVGKYNYFRISWVYPDIWQFGSQQNALLYYGTVDTVTVTS